MDDPDLLLAAISIALIPRDRWGDGAGLPVRPLIEIISDYALSVTTIVCGGGGLGFEDGDSTRARFSQPVTIAPFWDAKSNRASYLIADSGSYLIRQYTPSLNSVSTFAGTVNSRGSAGGNTSSCTLMGVWDLLPDQRSAEGVNRVWVADNSCVREIDVVKGEIRRLAGSSIGYADGPADAAMFFGLVGLALTRDGNAIICADQWNGRLRSIDIASGEVSTIAGNGENLDTDEVGQSASFRFPANLCWADGTRSQLYVCCTGSIRRFDVDSRAVSTVPLETAMRPSGIAVTPSGTLIVPCLASHVVYAVHPVTGATTRIAGKLGFGFVKDQPALLGGLVIDVTDQSALVVDTHKSCIRRVPLPVTFF